MSWTLDGRPLRRILITRLRYMGDIAMSTVVLEMLRGGDPDLEIDYLCEASYTALLRADTRLKNLHALAIERQSADAAARRASGAPTRADDPAGLGTVSMIRRLRGRRYDLAVDLFANPRSAWLLRLSGIKRRIAGNAGRRSRLYTHLTSIPPVGADPSYQRLAGGALGEHLSRLFPLVHAPTGLGFREWLLQARDGRPPAPRLILPAPVESPPPAGAALLLAPGATWETKEWPLSHWRQLIPRLHERFGGPIRILSSPAARNPAAALAQDTLAEYCRVLPILSMDAALREIANSRAVISVDGGVVHAAVALRRPTVALFGPTSPTIWFPYEGLGPYRVLCDRPACHPCDRHDCDEFICLPAIEPAAVEAALADLLSEGGSA